MIVVTSLSPYHANCDNQVNALKSWQQFGECFSLNTEKEIEILLDKGYEDITFIETNKTIKQFVGKDLVSINAMIDFARDQSQDLLLVNSDIILTRVPMFPKDGITIFTRHDYVETMESSKIFSHGFDAFYIPNKLLSFFPITVYAMGATHWDHSIPYRAIKSGIRVYSPTAKIAYHKYHITQYDYQEWTKMGEFFRWEFGLDKVRSIGQIASSTMATIRQRIIYI